MAMISDESGCRIVCGTCHKDIKDCCRPYYTTTLENDFRKAKEDNEKLKARVAALEAAAREWLDHSLCYCPYTEARCEIEDRLRALLSPAEAKPSEPCAACGGSGEVRIHEKGCRLYKDDPALKGLVYSFNLDGSCRWCYPQRDPCSECRGGRKP